MIIQVTNDDLNSWILRDIITAKNIKQGYPFNSPGRLTFQYKRIEVCQITGNLLSNEACPTGN
ncbi:hypothetical protein D3C81_2186700 [compost metagenome]